MDYEKALKEMIDSCFTYGGADRTNYNFERYILPYKDKVKDFNRIYESHLQNLKDNFEIEQNVYTDSEGLSYNSLVNKNNK